MMVTNSELLRNVNNAINAILSGGAVQSYSIAGRNLQYYSLKELMDLRNILQSAVASERGGVKTYGQYNRT